MNYLRSIVAVLSILLCMSFTPLHHGWADYDQTKALDFTGIIQSTDYGNPHAVIKLKQGEKIWTVILAPVSRMTERGVTAEMVKKGNSIRVVGYPHRRKKAEMRAESVFVKEAKFELR